MDLKTLRASRNTDFSKITSEFEKSSKPEGTKSYEDTRFWKPERDKAGNATATIRFLASTDSNELPWVKVFSHGFKGPSGRWYIEDSLTTIGQADPVSELNTKLWNSTTDDKSPARAQARAQKRKLNYISNILVVNDPKHPENNGKVFLFKYGKKIFDKIMDKAKPTFEDEEPVNVFDYWSGANFKLRVKMASGFPNYDDSVFETQSPAGSNDEAILAVAKQQYKLSDFTNPANFKSYEDLKKKLDMVLNGAPVMERASDLAELDAPAPRAAAPAKAPSKPSPLEVEDEDDMDLSYFQKLAE